MFNNRKKVINLLIGFYLNTVTHAVYGISAYYYKALTAPPRNKLQGIRGLEVGR